jgi:hypothetical protein
LTKPELVLKSRRMRTIAVVTAHPKKLETFPAATVPATQHDVDFMVKDSEGYTSGGESFFRRA